MRKARQFMPLTLVEQAKKFYSEWTVGGSIAVVILAVITSALLIMTYNEHRFAGIRGELWFTILEVVINCWMWLMILRKCLLKESKLKEAYALQREYAITDLGVFWGLYDISDTKIYYMDGSAAVIVSATRSYIQGRPTDFETQHFDKVSRFLRKIIRSGYSMKYSNIIQSDSNIKPLETTEAKINERRSSGIFRLESPIIKFTREVTENLSEVEHDYFLVRCRDSLQMPEMIEVVNLAISELNGGLFSDVHLCDSDEIYEFEKDFFGVEYINTNKMIKQAFEENEYKLVKVEEIIYTGEDSQQTRLDAERFGVSADNSRLQEEYQSLKRNNEIALEREFRAKQEWVLAQQGYKVSKLSQSRFRKLASKITSEQLNEADRELTHMRLEKLQDLKNNTLSVDALGAAGENRVPAKENRMPTMDSCVIPYVDLGTIQEDNPATTQQALKKENTLNMLKSIQYAESTEQLEIEEIDYNAII